MASLRHKIASFGLAVALALSPCACPLQAVALETADSAYVAIDSDALRDAGVPTSEQLDFAAPSQLIVTYSDGDSDIDRSLFVAKADGAPLEEVAVSEPTEETSLTDLGVTESEELARRYDACDASTSAVLTFGEGTDIQEVSAQLLSSPAVESVQPNYEYELFSLGDTSFHDATGSKSAYHPTNDPYSYVSSSEDLNQSYIYTSKIADAWTKGYKSSKSVSIAVIDTGPRLDHPDLSSAWDLEHARDFTDPTKDKGTKYTDSSSYWKGKTGYECHGTWVSGILGASANNGKGIAGTSYNAKVIPIKVTDGQSLYTSTIVKAYSYLDSLVESGELSTLKVINLSMGGEKSDPLFKEAIAHMTTHNVLTVASAGNYGDSSSVYPADYPDVLSVMAVNSDYTRAPFSSYRNKDVSALGVNVTTTSPYSQKWNSQAVAKYVKSGVNGTSFSAPIVSGVAALCFSAKRNATAMEVKQAITGSATSLKGIDSSCAPYLNALQAVKDTVSGKALRDTKRSSISSAKVSSISARTYSGKSQTPRPVVRLGGKTLARGKDYTLSYSNNTLPGKAFVTVTGKGSYKGTISVSFKILPKASKIVKLKAGTKSVWVQWKAQKASSSGYQICYSSSSKRNIGKQLKSGRKVLFVGAGKNSGTITRMVSKKRYYIQVRSYKKVKGAKYYSKWSDPRSIVTK